MSTRLKLAKQKESQIELRKLMSEHRAKTKPKTLEKITSPLAKYNEAGQLTCILCQAVVRSEDVWKVHVNAKKHRDNITAAKELREKTQNFSQPPKRAASPPPIVIPEKKLKSILKNTAGPATAQAEASSVVEGPSNQLPSDFFDNPSEKGFFETTLAKTSIKSELVNIKRDQSAAKAHRPADLSAEDDKALPEGFFDDPIKDAKARNQEYKDPVEEEWEKFQREIREEATVSNAIIAEDQEEATAERQIDEIDEQMRNWNRVLELERRKTAVADADRQHAKPMEVDDESESSSDDDATVADEIALNEFFDWRAKRSHR